MKVVRYSVQEHAEGFAIWELCPDWYARGACRLELWCQCLHSCGGPLRHVELVVSELGQALVMCEVLEAAKGGVKEVEHVVSVGAVVVDVGAGDSVA